MRPKIIFAVGGTGGHIFPAEKLASQLKEKGIEVLFAGAGLEKNRYFHRDQFSYVEVAPAKRTIGAIFQGIKESFKLLKKETVQLVVGFGSFHSFPILLAAWLKGIPFLLFEPNAYPGKVIRFFSRWARTTAIQFEAAKEKLSGKVVVVKMVARAGEKVEVSKAREYYHLDNHRPTFLVFGGSQGASAVNAFFAEAVDPSAQVIHLAGTEENAHQLRQVYEAKGILAVVKPFEDKMDHAWSAADVAVCRAGASTIAEQLFFEVPAILIPFPQAADDHQTKNAHYVKSLGGAVVFQEKELDAVQLKKGMEEVLLRQHEMRLSLKKRENNLELCTLISELIYE